MMELRCIVDGCENLASGLVCVNLNEPEVTIMMLPACTGDGQLMKTMDFTIRMRAGDKPIITLIDEDEPEEVPNTTLVYEAFSD